MVGIIVGIAVFLLGLSRFSLRFSNQVDLQLDVFSIVDLLVTVLLTVYVAGKLTRDNEQVRIEKQIIIEDLHIFKKDFIKSISGLLGGGSKVGLISVTSELKRLRSDFQSWTDLLESWGSLDVKTLTDSVDRSIRDIRDYFTDTAVSSADTTKSKIKGGDISLTSDTRTKIEREVLELRKNMFQLVVRINRN